MKTTAIFIFILMLSIKAYIKFDTKSDQAPLNLIRSLGYFCNVLKQNKWKYIKKTFCVRYIYIMSQNVKAFRIGSLYVAIHMSVFMILFSVPPLIDRYAVVSI